MDQSNAVIFITPIIITSHNTAVKATRKANCHRCHRSTFIDHQATAVDEVRASKQAYSQ